MTQNIKVEDFAKFIDLGYVNNWVVKPDIIGQCQDAKHAQYYTTVSNCVTLYWCPLCKYKFKVDSGD